MKALQRKLICFFALLLMSTVASAAERAVPEEYSSAIKIELLKLDPDTRYDSDIYRLTYSDLVSSGLLSSSVDPRTIKLYNMGKEQAIYIEGEEDGKFGSQDSLWFYGEPFTQTRYTYQNVYWLVWGEDRGKRTESLKVNADQVASTILKKTHYERNEQHQSKFEVADPWYFNRYKDRKLIDTYYFDLNGLDLSGDTTSNVNLRVHTYRYGEDYPDREIDVSINGQSIGKIEWINTGQYELNVNISSSLLVDGTNSVKIPRSAYYGLVYFDAIEITYPATSDLGNKQLSFKLEDVGKRVVTIESVEKNNTYSFAVKDSDIYRIESYSYSGNDMIVDLDSTLANNFIVATQSQAEQNVDNNLTMYKVSFEDLRSTKNQADYIIVRWSLDKYTSSQGSYYNEMSDEINRLLDYRKAQGLNVMAVGISDIYNEFSAGIPNPQAVKDFLEYTYTSWKSPRPSYVVLVGDATYDHREDELYDRMGNDYSKDAVGSYKQVPSYMFKNKDIINNSEIGYTATDDWFVCFDGEEDIFPEMTIGRLPARTASDLDVMVDKIIDFENTDLSQEHLKRISLFSGGEYDLDKTSELIANMAKGYDVFSLSPAGYGGSNFNQDLREELNNGSLFVNYSGHGSTDLWGVAWEGILDFRPDMWLGMFSSTIFENDDVDDLNNISKYQIYTSLSCMNGYLLKPTVGEECLAERLLKEEEKGAVAMFASSGVSLPTYQRYMAEGFYDAIFKRGYTTLGSAVIRAKLYLSNKVESFASNTAQSFMLFGDPALQIPLVIKDNVYRNPGPGNGGGVSPVGEIVYASRSEALRWQTDWGSLADYDEDEDDDSGDNGRVYRTRGDVIVESGRKPRPPVPPRALREPEDPFADLLSSATDVGYSAYLFDAALASGESGFETGVGISGEGVPIPKHGTSASIALQKLGIDAKVSKEIRVDDDSSRIQTIARAKESRLRAVRKLFRHRKDIAVSEEKTEGASRTGFWSGLLAAIVNIFKAVLRFIRGIF